MVPNDGGFPLPYSAAGVGAAWYGGWVLHHFHVQGLKRLGSASPRSAPDCE